MKQRRIVTVLAIITVTGAVNVPDSLSVAWRLDVSDRHVVDRGGLEWDPLIHTVGDTDGLPAHDPEYQTLGHPEHGAIPFTNRNTGEHESGSLSNEGRPSDTDVQKELSGASKSLSGHEGIPALPSADPMIEELSRAPR